MGSRRTTEWNLSYTEYDPEEQPLREALCALGNGHIVTRGAFEEVDAGGPHYPGTYLAGGYNRLETEIAGRVIENEDLVNWPNWLPLRFRPVGGDWALPQAVERLDFEYGLDVRRGVMERRIRFRDPEGREFSLVSRRLVHMAEPHLAAIEWRLTCHNWSGDIEILSGLDGTVVNGNVERYSDLARQHLEVEGMGQEGEEAIFLTVRTNQSRIRMCQAARTRVFEGDVPVTTHRECEEEPGRIAHRLIVPCQRNKELRIEKVVAIRTSRDFAISEPEVAARKDARRTGTFADLLESHERKWRHLWNASDLELCGDHVNTQLILRLHIFHLLQSTAVNRDDKDAGVPARGWHGEAYRGHIFWDELFIFPFLKLRFPELTRSLLMYRYRRLGEARQLARESGFLGAMFPWQSGSDGREESQVLHLNPLSGRWSPDVSSLQRHVNAAIAWNVWEYYEATADWEFLTYHGAEMLLEIARFWASAATWNSEKERYEILRVMGPDEFHTGYPDAEEPGLDNNAYTNVMASWVLRRALAALETVDHHRRVELAEELGLADEELVRWDEISRKLFVPLQEGGIISQFEGWEKLEEFDWQGYRERYGDIHRLDRILKAEDDHVNRYQASKQADVLMLFYLFSGEALGEMFEHLGYPFDAETIPRNIEYYSRRTSHGSTLSRIVHSRVLARANRREAWKFFQEALHSDIEDIQGGTTAEGIHLGAMAGTVDLIQRAQTGMETREGVLWLDPALPYELSDVKFRVRYRGHWISLRVTHDKLTVSCERGCDGGIRIGFRGEVHPLARHETLEFALEDGEEERFS